MMYQLRPYQVEAIGSILHEWDRHRSTLLVLATGLGKCLGRGTPVMLFDGRVVPVEDIAKGDLLMGPDSLPRTVVGTCTGREPLYRVTPTKGDSYVVNESHILSVRLSGDRRVTLNGEACEAGSVVNLSVLDWQNAAPNFRHTAKGWRAPADFLSTPTDADLPPYLLGTWLGDGTSATTAITTEDPEIEDAWRAYAGARGHCLRRGQECGNARTFHVTRGVKVGGRGRNTNAMLNALRRFNLVNNKHVPHAYKANSRDIRLEVLAGLIDTDGSAIPGGGFDYVSKSEVLADDVCFIARSLGLAAYKRRCQKASQNGTVGTYYRVGISGDCSIVPCRIARKRSPARTQKKSVLVTGIRVDPIGEGDYFGFELEGPDKLFLLGDFTVTHNTTCFSEIARKAKAEGGRTLVLAHRIELVQQAAARLETATVPTQIESGAQRASWLQWPLPSAVVATVQTLKGKRLKQWPRNFFSRVVIDEAHHATAHAYRDILDHFDEAKVLGVTATPGRSDGVALGGIFDSVAYELGIVEGIRQGYLCDLVPLTIPLDGISIDDVKVTKQEHGRDLDPKALAEKVNADAPMLVIASSVIEHTLESKRKTLVFMPSVETAHALAKTLAAHPGVGPDGVRSLDGQTDPVTRKQVLRDFQSGRVQYLVNCALFTEGFDAPIVSCVAIVRMTKSLSLFMQMIGRGTRTFEGKQNCLVLNFRPENTKHDLAEAIDIFDGKALDSVTRDDIKQALKEGASVREAQDKAKERSAARERRLAQERSAARERRLAQERAKSNLVAKVSYTATPTALWSEQVLGAKPAHYSAGIPAALPQQLATLEGFGVKPLPNETVASASAKIKALAARSRKGLCSYKQGKVLGDKGLNPDLTRAEARLAIDALVANGWKANDEMRLRWARKENSNG